MATDRPALRFFPQKPPESSAATGDGIWIGYTQDGIMLRVAGTEAGPHASHAATLWQLVDHVTETMKSIEVYAASLPPETPIAFEHPTPRATALAARHCGFEIDSFHCEEISVTNPDDATSARIDFRTALEDGYISFRTTLDGGQPRALTVVLS